MSGWRSKCVCWLLLAALAGACSSSESTGPRGGAGAAKDPFSPRVASFTKSGDRLTPTLSVTFEATISDPQGIDDIVSVKLLDVDGTSYGSFDALSEGTYAFTLDWRRAHEVQAISGTQAGVERTFQLEVIDRDDHHTFNRIDLNLTCDTTSEGPCNGVCIDMLQDDFNCGGCDLACSGASTNPNSPLSYCREALCHEVYESFDARTSCTAACASLGGTCDHDGVCPGEVCDLEEQSWAEYGNMSLRVPLSGCDAIPEATVSGESFSSLHCNCDDLPAGP